jgi:hypothetical protein
MPKLIITEYLEGAALRAAGGALIDAQMNERGRVDLIFDDAGGHASELQREHRAGRLQVCSRDFADAVGAVKNTIFAARRS